MATPPDFTTGQVLTAAQMNAVGLWLIKTQTVGTTVSSVTVSDVFSSDYENYKITYTGGTSNTAQAIRMQLGSSSTGYYLVLMYASYASPTYTSLADNNATVWSYAGEAGTSTNALNLDLIGPNLAKPTVIQGHYGPSVSGHISGYHNVSTAYTGFTLSVAGNLTGGIIRVYGYRK